MALACLACHSLDNSTDSFRMDGSFRMQNMSVRSAASDDGRDGCGGVSACIPKSNKRTVGNSRQESGGPALGDSTAAPKPESRGVSSFFGRPKSEAALGSMVFPEPRLTRCHAVRRDLFSNWTVGDVDTKCEGRRLCFNLSSTTA